MHTTKSVDYCINLSRKYIWTGKSSLRPLSGRFCTSIAVGCIAGQDSIESVNQDLTSSKINTFNDIMMIEQKISQLVVRYKQKTKAEQQKSVLVTTDMLHISRRMTNYVADKPCMNLYGAKCRCHPITCTNYRLKLH